MKNLIIALILYIALWNPIPKVKIIPENEGHTRMFCAVMGIWGLSTLNPYGILTGAGFIYTALKKES